jgi:hypothetical protein
MPPISLIFRNEMAVLLPYLAYTFLQVRGGKARLVWRAPHSSTISVLSIREPSSCTPASYLSPLKRFPW